MSDPIADILERYAKAYPHVHPDRVQQQIRQQIGRELLERRHQLDEFVRLQDICKVCQLEES